MKRSLQRRDGVIVGAVWCLGADCHENGRMHACARAEKLCLGVVTDLLVSFGILRERTGIDQAGIIQAPKAKPHPEVMRLRFDKERSPLDVVPEDIRKPLYDIVLPYTEGMVVRKDGRWVELHSPMN